MFWFVFSPRILREFFVYILLTVLWDAELKGMELPTIISTRTERFKKSLLVAFDFEQDGSIMHMYYMKAVRAVLKKGEYF